jgi:broad specificity phosphatase PhoE
MNRLRLVAAAPTPALRRGEFGGDHDLDEGGTRAALALRKVITGGEPWVCAPSRAAEQTAWALAREPAVAPALADPDQGEWTGRTMEQVDPAALRQWLADPQFAPPGGESLAAVVERVGAWLDTQAGARLVAVAHPIVVRAALTHALGLPPAGIWHFDVAPLSVTRLGHRAGRWHLYLTPIRS